MLSTINEKKISYNNSNDKIVKKLVSLGDEKEIKSELIKAYLKQEEVDISDIKNNQLYELISTSNEHVAKLLEESNKRWTLKDIEFVIFSSFHKDITTKNGVIFTPNSVSNYINKEILKDANPNKTICDFACGCGEFLISSLYHLKDKFPDTSAVSLIENNLFGADILEVNVYWTKIFLTLVALQYGEDEKEINFNIVKADSTDPDILNNFNNLKVLSGFDYIVGNPPYVKHQDLSEEKRSYLTKTFKTCNAGNFNLFYAFVELSFKNLKDDGKIGYIVPNHLLKMKSAKSLRSFLLDQRLIDEVIDFKDNQLFDNAQTYSAIIFFDKSKKEEIRYKTIDYKINSYELKDEIQFQKKEFISYKKLEPDTINLLSEQELSNINKIEGQPYNLKISTGIATQKDTLYIIDTTKEINKNEDNYYYIEYKGINYPIEKGITMPLIKGSGDKKIDSESRFYEFKRIIYPYKNVNGKAITIAEDEMFERFPKTLEYFKVIRNELNKRNKGKPKVNIWYEYGRSQALNSFVPKIIFPTNSAQPNFTFFDDYALFNNGYAIYGLKENSDFNLEVLSKILNSRIMTYYIRLTSYMISGGYYCYQKKYLTNFSIPKFTNKEMNYLKTVTSSEELNEFLINKYGLSL